MILRKMISPVAVLALLAALSLSAPTARAAVVDYVGFAWETGGIVPSTPGDELSIATVVTQIDPVFNVDLNTNEATVFISGLTSVSSTVNPSTGATTTTYSGGTLWLYSDPSGDHDWGTNPANGTVPSTFVNGSLVFEGNFTGFAVTMLPSGSGIYEGFLDGTGGSALGGPCTGCAYTFAGTFTPATGANIPLGYDMQVDGQLDVESAVANENINWGSLKQLFR